MQEAPWRVTDCSFQAHSRRRVEGTCLGHTCNDIHQHRKTPFLYLPCLHGWSCVRFLNCENGPHLEKMSTNVGLRRPHRYTCQQRVRFSKGSSLPRKDSSTTSSRLVDTNHCDTSANVFVFEHVDVHICVTVRLQVHLRSVSCYLLRHNC